ncbi:hypothetical protein AYK25_05865 [Thermoplasmatales archaeon SM1-50]|nr:MAG: hypothetical protein AYK25_05865 [Thermoplasmatales archaeon SM1-50]
MIKNTWYLSITCILVLIVTLSGCEMILPPTMYEATATKISYDISYGYHVQTMGRGSYEINYLCDIPEVISGTITYDLLYNDEYQIKTLFDNTFIDWNISGMDQRIFDVGVTARVEAAGYLITDLNGADSLTIAEIQERYPEIFDQYTKLQANTTIRFIDPYDPKIISTASMVSQDAQTTNSLLLAQSLFSWLKKNIQYQIHPNEGTVRPASITLESRQGDCDDLSFLYISLCRAVGIPARFIRGYLLTENIDGSVTATAHAWVDVFVGVSGSLNGWIPVECASSSNSIEINIHQNFGLETASHLRLFTDDGSNASLETSLTGISYVTRDPSITIILHSFAEINNFQVLESKNLVITDSNMRYYK